MFTASLEAWVRRAAHYDQQVAWLPVRIRAGHAAPGDTESHPIFDAYGNFHGQLLFVFDFATSVTLGTRRINKLATPGTVRTGGNLLE
jgi:hypothetical protein